MLHPPLLTLRSILLSISTLLLSCLQGKEPNVRQLALLHFRNTIVLSVKLEDALSRPRARIPPSVTQMLLILQVCTEHLSLSFSLLFVSLCPSHTHTYTL